MTVATKSDGETKRWSEFWHVTQRTVQRWGAAHERGEMPHYSNVPEILAWRHRAHKPPPEFMARCDEIEKNGIEAPPAKPQPEPDLDWQTFKKQANKRLDHAQIIAQMEEFAAFYQYKLERANDKGDKAEQSFYSGLFFDAANSIRQQKLAADKLGIEEGQLFTKAQLARFIRAFAFWSMRGVDGVLAEVCPKMPGVKSVNDGRNLLEPVLLSERFVKPFAKAARVESESALSGWMVETVKDAVDDYIENGAKEFEEVEK